MERSGRGFLVVIFLFLFGLSLVLIVIGLTKNKMSNNADEASDNYGSMTQSQEDVEVADFFDGFFKSKRHIFVEEAGKSKKIEVCEIGDQEVRQGVSSGDTICATE